jgi:hypothetical protein
MARVLIASWMVRYPLGGNLSWALQWLVGFHRLGHDVHLVERSGYPDSCYDPVRNRMSDDCSYGAATVASLLARHGLEGRWCYLDADGRYHGATRKRVDELFASADVFVDMGAPIGSWRDESGAAGLRVLVDTEPAYTQIKLELGLLDDGALDGFDPCYSVGQNIGTPRTTAPSAGRRWRTVLNPVVTDLFAAAPPPRDAPFTTVMNWQAHETVEWKGRTYGQKDAELERFLDLPRLTGAPLELSVAGRNVPRSRLARRGWRLNDAHAVTRSVGSYASYISSSAGEFAVCKQVFVATRSGWFSDRSAAYLASGRPVVLQDTGFASRLPCGEGLFAVRDADEAAAAIERIRSDPARQEAAARELAREHLDARVVLPRLLDEIGVA